MADGPTGGVDANIALQARPPANNPLEQVGQFANALQGINQLKLFPGQLQLQQQAVQGGQVGLSQRINQAVNQGLTPLLALQPGQITHKAVTDALAGMEARGIPTHGFMTDNLLSTPMPDGPDFEARARAVITSQAMQSPESSVGAVTGSFAPQQQGYGIQPGFTPGAGAPGFGGFKPVGPVVPMYLTPGERVSQIGRLVTPEEAQSLGVKPGTKIDETLDARLKSQGLNHLTGPGQSPFGDGRFQPPPPALVGPGSSSAPAATPGQGANTPVNLPPTGPVGGAAPRPVVTGLDPATQTALTNTGTQATAGFGDITQQGMKARQQDAVLANMQNELSQFSSGTGAEKTLDFKRAIISWAPSVAAAIGVDPKAVAANESFNKLVNQIADAQGAGSDARLSVTQHANPSAELSPPGADLILRQLRGNADYLRAQQQVAAQYPDQTDYRGFSAKFSKEFDPRAFQLSRMLPDQQKTYLQNIKDDADKANVKRAWIKAQQSGLLGTQ